MNGELDSTSVIGNPFIWTFAFPLWLYIHAQVQSKSTLFWLVAAIIVLSVSRAFVDKKIRLLKAQGTKTTNEAVEKFATSWFWQSLLLMCGTIGIYIYGLFRIWNYYAEPAGYYLFWIGVGGFVYNAINILLNIKSFRIDYDKAARKVFGKKKIKLPDWLCPRTRQARDQGFGRDAFTFVADQALVLPAEECRAHAVAVRDAFGARQCADAFASLAAGREPAQTGCFCQAVSVIPAVDF